MTNIKNERPAPSQNEQPKHEALNLQPSRDDVRKYKFIDSFLKTNNEKI
jgi:hypothetical protein